MEDYQQVAYSYAYKRSGVRGKWKTINKWHTVMNIKGQVFVESENFDKNKM